MITEHWHYIDLHIDEWPLLQVECKLDLTYRRGKGWHVLAVIADGQRIEMDGSRKRPDGTSKITPLGLAIADEAPRYFEKRRDQILADENLLEKDAA